MRLEKYSSLLRAVALVCQQKYYLAVAPFQGLA
jgi:hypothetical protein